MLFSQVFPHPSSLLVANRGEIAARVFRTASELGVRSIAVYADPDRGSAWTALADEAYNLPGETSADTYMNADALLEIAQRSGAEALHPGYGFLSENADFARRVREAGITWVGPAPEVIHALGDKAQARELAQRIGVGVIPGTDTPPSCVQEILEFGRAAGYPILLKDPAGGGGRGIIECADEDAVHALMKDRGLSADADLRASGAFGQSFLEKRLVGARHIETQCLRDSHGFFWLASTRDCSVQRRNQKLIEEAPAPALSEHTLHLLHSWSRALFDEVGYVGAGTCEFLVDADGTPYFLEVNPRLQVEHTVTEEVTGTDLVALQLAVASGARLGDFVGEHTQVRGCSIQLRITSEDPARGLMPSGGTLQRLVWPAGPGIRLDAALAPGESIPTAFDSLIAKIIVTAPTRPQAIARALRALNELQIEGVAHSSPLYSLILNDEDFTVGDGRIHTRWLEGSYLSPEGLRSLEASLGGGQTAEGTGIASATTASPAQDALTVDIEIDGKRHRLRLPSGLFSAGASPAQDAPTQVVRRGRRSGARSLSADPGVLTAPMQATVTRIPAQVGDRVNEGDLVLVIEAMKMEQPLYAGVSGTVASLDVEVGQSVSTGQVLLTVDHGKDEE